MNEYRTRIPRSSYAVPVWKSGTSVVIPLYKLLLHALGIRVGDLLLVRVHPPFATFRVLDPHDLIPVEQFTAEDFPPNAKPEEKSGRV